MLCNGRLDAIGCGILVSHANAAKKCKTALAIAMTSGDGSRLTHVRIEITEWDRLLTEGDGWVRGLFG